MVLTGICITVYQPLFFLGTARNGVAVGTVVALGSAPILAGLLEWALTRRLPSATWMLATALATAGVVLLGFGGAAGGAGGTDPIGILGVDRRRSLVRGHRERPATAARRRGGIPFTVVGAMGASAAVLSAFLLPFVDLAWLGTTSGLAMALWLGFATMAIAYVLFTWGLSGLTAATAATLTLGEPLTAEDPGHHGAGRTALRPSRSSASLVLAGGLALLAWGSRSPRDPAPFAVEG